MKIQGTAINPFQIKKAFINESAHDEGKFTLTIIYAGNDARDVWYYKDQESAESDLDYVEVILERMLPRSCV